MGIATMLTTPETIRTLQRKLYRKAKQEPACRFHALYDKVYRADILSHAYKLVVSNATAYTCMFRQDLILRCFERLSRLYEKADASIRRYPDFPL